MITLVNGYVLFPHPADWSTPPESQRVWQTELSEALPGSETRQALRAVARRQLSFTITAKSLQERARLDSRWDAAAKSGLACAPFFGRGGALAAGAALGAFSLTASLNGAWNWQAGDYVCLLNDDTMFDVSQVTAYNAGTGVLTLQTALGFAWPAGWTVWPLIFGKFTADKAAPFTSWHESVRLTIAQLVAERTVQLGNIAAPVVGIGAMVVGSTFTVA